MTENLLMAAWRRRIGLTQIQAAEILGLSRRSIQSYDNAEPEKLPNTLRLAMAYVLEHHESLDLKIDETMVRAKMMIPSKEATLIAETIVQNWQGRGLNDADVPLVLAIAEALDAVRERRARIANEHAAQSVAARRVL